MASDAHLDHLWQRRSDAIFAVRVSYVYHRNRQRFYDLIDRSTKAATVLMGASMLSTLVQGWLPVLGGLISGLGLLSLVFGYSDRKQAHRELADSFAALESEIERVGELDFTEANVNDWHARLQAMCAKEPPPLYAAVTLAENQVNRAMGHPDRVVAVPWVQRALSSFFSFSRGAH